MTSVDAASFVAISTAIAYTTTFIGATLADKVWGEYVSIIAGACGLYIPGLLLLALTTVPYLLGETFDTTALTVALLFMWPLGTGIVKSVVNVFGAKQVSSWHVWALQCLQ
jgi:POT family proton-dependent oligopeptide transporter